MLIEEAKWFGQKISSIEPYNIFPMLNVGSSTERYRKIDQPWVDEYIFKPARKKKQKVLHMDIKHNSGVDIIGDLSDPIFLRKISKMKFNSVFCSNVLELLPNKKEICKILTSIIPEGGYIFVSCPYRYPFYVDYSKDTMFRPDIHELSTMFPNTVLVYGEIIKGGTYFDYLDRSILKLIKAIIRIFIPFYKPMRWLTAVNHLPWLFRNFEVTCLVLRKMPHKNCLTGSITQSNFHSFI